MGDVGDDYKFLKELKKDRREKNLASANGDGWTKHTEYHWSRLLNGIRIDYWPSRNKFQYDGRVMTGDVNAFIAKRETK